MRSIWLTASVLLPLLLPLQAHSFDLVIRGGRVIDGMGNPARFADLAIRDGRIAGIGIITNRGRAEISARGLIVAPGFIDVHTHAEEIDELPLAENFLRMGVTTLVLGNCGASVREVGDFFRRLEATNISANVATLIGHGTMRARVMGGSFDRPPTEEELTRMRGMVDRAMQEGALGFSTGLIYLPGTFARTEEIIELAKIVARHDGLYASHMRSEGAEIFDALDELFRIAREGGVRAHVSHIKVSGVRNWGRANEVLAAIDRAREDGLDITQDQYAYTASSTGISQLVPDKFREGGQFNAHYSNATKRAEMAAVMKSGLQASGRTNYAYAVIADYKRDRSLNGLDIVAAAKKIHGSDTIDAQVETILAIHRHGGASAVFHGMNEEDLRQLMQHPNTMFASDSAVRRFEEGMPHPRGYGNNARILGRYVRDLGLLRLEDAVRRMSFLPASTFGLRDRGAIRRGAWADLVVFDPNAITDGATFDSPHHYATGFTHVFVNGIAVVSHDQHTGARPGRTLRRNQD